MDPNLVNQNNPSNPVVPTPHVVVPSPSQGDNSQDNNSGNPKNHSRMIGVLLILIIAVAIPLTVFVSQQQQNIKQNAATAKVTPTPSSTLDSCGYPYSSSNAKTSIFFNESEVLRDYSPKVTGVFTGSDKIIAWYNDEHALTLGVTTSSFPVSSLPGVPGSVQNPQVGDPSAVDPSGRPIWPALFITDVTSNLTNKSGDWQNGGTAHKPTAVYGTWKAATITTSGTLPGTDPAINNWTLGSGSDTVPASLTNQGYGTEIVWDVASLTPSLIVGHSYRFQFMVHDGDQNKTGGDVGEACSLILATTPTVTPITSVSPSVTATPTPGVTSTPTPTLACMVPNKVLNVKITCPNCNNTSLTPTPTITPTPTDTGGNQ